MGFRGHVREVNEIKYGACSYSDYNQTINVIEYYNDVSCNDDEFVVDDTMVEWEFEIEKFSQMVEYFNKISNQKKIEISEKLNIDVKDFNYIIEDLNDWLEDGKKAETGYITIDWF